MAPLGALTKRPYAFVVLTVATVAIVWVAEAAAGAVPVAAILAVVVMAHWAVEMNVGLLVAPSGPTAAAVPEPERFAYGSHLFLGFAWAAMFGAAGYFAQGRSTHAIVPMLWSASPAWLNFVQAFVFPPSHAELLPVRESKKERAAYDEQVSKGRPSDFEDDDWQKNHATSA